MKVFNSIEEINEAYGVSVSLPHIFPYDMYAVFEVIEPNHVEYWGLSSESGISFLPFGYWIVCKPIVKDMEEYIREYKHLVGCEYVTELCRCFYLSEGDVDFVRKYPHMLGLVKFYLDDDTLGTYEEYMELHYPQYKHVWQHQV